MEKPDNQLKSDGSAYGRRLKPTEKEVMLAQVGAGTPAGELLRRYWHPIQLSAAVTTRPQKIRVLGEDLILFRDGKGRLGLLTPNCAHRGTSLFYGKVDENGIRCCYHGWQYDVQGRCIDQPCEPEEGGFGRDHVRQPWYPVEQRYGLVFAYMGPPAKKPVLPRWEVLENLQDGELIYVHGYTGFGVGADDTVKIVPMSWLKNWENIMDPFHVPILHTRHSAIQYTPEAAKLPTVDYRRTDIGLNYIAHRIAGSGRVIERVSSVVMPTLVLVPDQQLDATGPTKYVRWLTPVDDDAHALFHVLRLPPNVDGPAMFERVSRPRPMGTSKMWSEMTEEEHQSFPTDWEAMCSQTRIDQHSEEHLGMSDVGVVNLHRLLREQIRAVEEGRDPVGVTFDEAHATFKTTAGNFLRMPDAPSPAA